MRELEALGVPSSAPTAARARRRCSRRCSGWPRSCAPRSSRPCPTPARPPSWTAATSTCARPSTWRRARAASCRRGRASWAAAAAPRPPTSGTWCARCACSSRGATVEAKVVDAAAAQGGARAGRRARQKSPLARALRRKFVVSVELDPPRGADAGQIIERAQYCKENEVDAINVADGPRASARMSAQALCVLLQEKVGIDTILHYTCRDRNLLGIQSDLLGAHALGLRNILAITGDPPKLGDYPDATAVYDVDSIGLIRIMDNLNHGARPGRQPDRPRARDPHGLRRRPEQARHRQGGAAARGEGEGRRRVHHDAAGLRPADARALPVADQAPRRAGAGRDPAALLAQERRVPAQRGARA